MASQNTQPARVSTGISALDEIIWGGLPKGEIYVVNGAPGTGKTILARYANGLSQLDAKRRAVSCSDASAAAHAQSPWGTHAFIRRPARDSRLRSRCPRRCKLSSRHRTPTAAF
ncbi:hypothetical protein IQ241_07885 [Romeria aff. gracilis LEGE 07310]|uniref:KaiC-like domain-containing protein n=1 Tax=Vasconcelosia minhoensis LEGE 07310 TaxID=915328 RepID=A0A8J7AMJ9_9CYAN|nr:hypothetical protein [Romeria aff. gracilis LEGE 07310]